MREARGGVTTFMAMAYILLLNPLIPSGKDGAGGHPRPVGPDHRDRVRGGLHHAEVAAAALVAIDAMMMNARYVGWADRATAIPVFLTPVIMPFTYSITAGAVAGVISYVVIEIAQGRAREIGAFLWALTAVFLVYFALNPIESWMGVR